VSSEGASGGDVSGGGVTGDEAAWRDLVARYDMPADVGAGVPWPERENLTAHPRHAKPDSGEEPAPEGRAVPGAPDGRGAPGTPDARPVREAGPAGQGPARRDPEGNGPDRPGPAGQGPLGAPAGADRTRVIRPATPPHGPARVPGPAAEAADDDEHYIPPPPPPLPHLDPIAKGAWTALFGGPAYLLLASLLSWTVPGWAALLAVMGFVGGFAVVVLRLGDKPSRGEGPDNGAVL
jgi:hypothetical protein